MIATESYVGVKGSQLFITLSLAALAVLLATAVSESIAVNENFAVISVAFGVFSVFYSKDVRNLFLNRMESMAPTEWPKAVNRKIVSTRRIFYLLILLCKVCSSWGWTIIGESVGDRTGHSVSSAGDVNGDGYDDIIVGGDYSDPFGRTFAGRSYVIFGKSGGFVDIDLSNLNSSVGYRINGASQYEFSGYSVSSAGDMNGDGYDDIIIGAYQANTNGLSTTGRSYVIFGKSGGFVDIDLLYLDSTVGYTINGAALGDASGHSVSSAGDVNGDSYDDIIIGADQADPYSRTTAGTSHVIFGKSGGFVDINLSNLDSTVGYRIDGASEMEKTGHSVSSAGDVNGDGYDDIIIGAFQASPYSREFAGRSYVIFGKSGGFVDIDLLNLNSSLGYTINGAVAYDNSGHSVSSAGDVNGDGYDDIIIGAPRADPYSRTTAGISYVIFGKSGGFADIDLLYLDSSVGYRINGAVTLDNSGRAVSSAGDVNGDGYGDIIVGAFWADPYSRNKAGTSYVIFGKSDGFADIDLLSMDSSVGYRINGAASDDFSGFSVSSAGDVNGDGYDDIIIGAEGADLLSRSNAGKSYVIFGKSGGFVDIDLSISTSAPTAVPTEMPILSPTEFPTFSPTNIPNVRPTMLPTESPTAVPTAVPTDEPTESPSDLPTQLPTFAPTESPTLVPTTTPIIVPTESPTTVPSIIDGLVNTPICFLPFVKFLFNEAISVPSASEVYFQVYGFNITVFVSERRLSASKGSIDVYCNY